LKRLNVIVERPFDYFISVSDVELEGDREGVAYFEKPPTKIDLG
jgi:hypothetical protein